MRRNLLLGSGVVLFTALLALVVWQGSFTIEPLATASPEQTYVFWGLSTLVFLLTVLLGFLLFRTGVKLYIERQRRSPGAHLRWKLVAAALALSITPVLFLVLFSVEVLNRNLDKWFSRPAEQVLQNLEDVRRALIGESQAKVDAEAHWMAALPPDPATWERFCREHGIEQAELSLTGGAIQTVCAPPASSGASQDRLLFMATAPAAQGRLTISARMPDVLANKHREIDRYRAEYLRLAQDRREYRRFYVLLLLLITLFILFFATWLALFLSRLISIPITALLHAAEEVRGGNLAHRLRIGGIDELGLLVKAFNEMTAELESSRGELDNRRRFTEAILESIPTGVISLSADGSSLSVNRALKGILPAEQISRAARISDLFSREDATEIRYLMNRARRTGVAGSQLELKTEGRTMQLSATVAALEERRSSGFVLVLEDTSELLRAQRALAWQEVARRIAHEIKNPLTPIALSADRIARQLERGAATDTTRRILRRMLADHSAGSGIRAHAGRRIFAIQPLPHGATRSLGPQRHHRERSGRVSRPPAGHPRPQGARTGAAHGQRGSGTVQTRDREPGGQRGRGHAGFAWLKDLLVDHLAQRRRYGGAGNCRHRLRRIPRGP